MNRHAKIIITLILAPLLLSLSCQAPLPTQPITLPEPEKPVPIVCIDAGHQLRGNQEQEPLFPGSKTTKDKVSTGTRGVVTGIPEHEVNLQIALELEKLLQARQIQVVMVRNSSDTAISNKERAEIANEVRAHLFLRLHCDYSTDKNVKGIGIFYPAPERELITGTYDLSKKAAQSMNDTFKKLNFTTAPLQPRADLTGFNWSKVPTVLVEMGFMSNPAEDSLLSTSEYQLKLAEALSLSLEAYLAANPLH